MTHCQDMEERLALYVVGELETAECAAVERHLAECAACREVCAELRAGLGLLREGLEHVPVRGLDSEHRTELFTRARETVSNTPPTGIRGWFLNPRTWAAAAALVLVCLGFGGLIWLPSAMQQAGAKSRVALGTYDIAADASRPTVENYAIEDGREAAKGRQQWTFSRGEGEESEALGVHYMQQGDGRLRAGGAFAMGQAATRKHGSQYGFSDSGAMGEAEGLTTLGGDLVAKEESVGGMGAMPGMPAAEMGTGGGMGGMPGMPGGTVSMGGGMGGGMGGPAATAAPAPGADRPAGSDALTRGLALDLRGTLSEAGEERSGAVRSSLRRTGPVAGEPASEAATPVDGKALTGGTRLVAGVPAAKPAPASQPEGPRATGLDTLSFGHATEAPVLGDRVEVESAPSLLGRKARSLEETAALEDRSVAGVAGAGTNGLRGRRREPQRDGNGDGLDVVSGVLTSERLEQAENERKARPEAEDQLSALAFSEPSLMSSTAVAEERLSEALVAPAAPPPPVLLPSPEPDLEPRPRPEPVRVNPFVTTATDNLATFALDTDTASYAQTRTYIQNQGLLPPPGIVRVEEFVNAFDYNYPAQAKGTFSVHSQAAPSPFRPRLTLLKVGVKARVIGRDGLRPVHLVLVVDASGSMSQTDRMPLVMAAVDTLLDQLSPVDRVSLVTYDTHARLLLDAVPAESATTVRAAVEGLQCTGSTNLVEGLRVGYERAVRHFTAGWNSRVVLCSDGVTNVGATETDAILDVVRTYRDQGIGLTTVGFGTGAYNDALLEQLANRGDGQYLFVDSEVQARQTFAREIAGALQTVAYDAKIQVEFNPHRVHRYRLLGYENRDIADSDFRNDTVDAGEVGSGQSATALFELELLPGDGRSMPRDLGTVYVRYRDVDSGEVEETATRITEPGLKPLEVADAPRFHLASLAAEFAEVLRGSAHVRGTSLESLVGPARAVAEALPLDQGVAELRDLISQACGLPRAQP